MHAIPNPIWEGVTSYTWADLSAHRWECFHLALYEIETAMSTTGVVIQSASDLNLVITEQQAQGVLIVQSPVIMQTRTEMITSIVVSTKDYFSDMMKYLPLYERKSNVFRMLITTDDRELRNTEQQLEIVKRNIFIDTAIEALPIYERDLGIENPAGLNYAQRREQVIARNIASFEQTTEETIKRIAAAFSNGEVEINKTSVPGIYEIKFVGTKGIPNNIEGLKGAIDIVAPAHLQFDYTFTFNSWGFLANKTWGGVSHVTWNELRNWEGAS
ncbi:putative phage tail protein [Lysinibacillus capsici]|uniref:putative phage tail protein n=1 Tax=Lysinibacillus capsici TaxID=2115968 RepID=UPI0032E46542